MITWKRGNQIQFKNFLSFNYKIRNIVHSKGSKFKKVYKQKSAGILCPHIKIGHHKINSRGY